MKVLLVKDRNVLNTRWLTQFANDLSDIGHQVHVVCDSYSKQGTGEYLSDSVEFTNLNAKTSNPIINIYRYVRQHLSIPSFRFGKFIKRENPDVIICYFKVDVFNVCFLQKKIAPIIYMGHNYPVELFEKLNSKPIKSRIYRPLIESVDVFQVLIDEYQEAARRYYNFSKIVTIGNAVRQIPKEKRTAHGENSKNIIYVGRLDGRIKRQHYLIEAFSAVAEQFPDWTVEFWGMEKHEKYKESLLDLIREKGLQNQVFVRGFTRDIEGKYRDSSINAFPSKLEGFSLGLADGMAMGLPSIGFSDAPSVSAVIEDSSNGYLVDSIEAFSDKLAELMRDVSLRKRMGEKAAEDMREYSPEVIISKWDSLIHSVVEEYKSERR